MAAPRAHLTDFGLARARETGSRLTRTGEALGTPAYMSPEQARGEVTGLSPATDSWSLGCVLFELLAGRPPFEGESVAAVVGSVLTRAPTPISRIRTDLPRGLADVTMRALAKPVRDRYPDTATFRDDLDRILAGGRPRCAGPRRGRVAGLAAVALLALGLGAWAVHAGGRQAAGGHAAAADAPEHLAAQGWALRTSDLPRATAMLGHALQQQPGRHDWRLQHGLLRWAAGDGAGARETWRAVPDAAPEATRAWWWRGLASAAEAIVEKEAALYTESRDAWRQAAAGQGPEATWARAGLAMDRADFAAARQHLGDARGWDAALLRAFTDSTARSRGEAWDAEVQLRAYSEVIADGPPLAVAYRFRSLAYEAKGDSPAARRDLDAALRLAPRWAQAWRDRAGLRARGGDPEGALADFAEAIALEPASARNRLERGRLRKELGQREAAREDFDAAVALDPEEPYGRCCRGVDRWDRGDIAGAIEDYDATLRRKPDLREARHGRGVARRAAGDVRGAYEDFTAELALDPDSGNTRRLRALAMRDLGNADGALDELGVLLARAPGDVEALMARGEILIGRGDLAAAARDLDAAVAAAPGAAAPRTARSVLRFRRQDLAGAREDLDASIALDPSVPEAWMNRAGTKWAARDVAGAIADLEEALRIAPARWEPRADAERQLAQARAAAAGNR